jgi:hypothetical protein
MPCALHLVECTHWYGPGITLALLALPRPNLPMINSEIT